MRGDGYAKYTNGVYKHTLGGGASQIRKRMGLPVGVNVRDHLPTVALVTVMLTEAVTTEQIEATNARGNTACLKVCETVSEKIGGAIAQARL